MSHILLRHKMPPNPNPEFVYRSKNFGLNMGLHGRSQEFKKWLFRKLRPFLHKGVLDDDTPVELKIYYQYYLERIVPTHKDLGRHKLDRRIYIKKYYPWCYRNYMPTVVLQGWWSRKEARNYYRERFGPDAITNIRFMSGGNILARGFEIGCSLPINGRWIPIVNKIPYATAMEDKPLLIRGLNKHSKRTTEKKVNIRLKYYQYGRNASERMLHYKQTGKAAQARISKVQEAFERRKTSLYEE